MKASKEDAQAAIAMLQPALVKTFKYLAAECRLLDVGLYEYAMRIKLEFQKINDNIDVADFDNFCLFGHYFTEQYNALTAANLISQLGQDRLSLYLGVVHDYSGPYIMLVGLRNSDKKIATAALLGPPEWQKTVDALLAVAAVQNNAMQGLKSMPVISRGRVYKFSYRKGKNG